MELAFEDAALSENNQNEEVELLTVSRVCGLMADVPKNRMTASASLASAVAWSILPSAPYSGMKASPIYTTLSVPKAFCTRMYCPSLLSES